MTTGQSVLSMPLLILLRTASEEEDPLVEFSYVVKQSPKDYLISMV